MHPSVWVRTVLALSTIPVAILANGFRVAGTGIAAHYYGPEAAEGFFHSFSGWIVFIASFAMLFLIHRVIAWWAPPPPRAADESETPEKPGKIAPAAPPEKPALAAVPPSTPGHQL
jgi:exosortase/archaeosortase family protein